MTTITNSTLLIHVESGAYPLTLSSLKARHPNVSFGTSVDEELMLELGYAVVTPTAQPVGDVVTEAAPALQGDGSYAQAYDVRNYSPEEVASQLDAKKSDFRNAVNNLRDTTLANGAPVDFGGEYGVQHVQMRDGDRVNFVGLKLQADLLISQGVNDPVVPLRTREDKIVRITPEQTVALSWIVSDGYIHVMEAAWTLKDAATAASTQEEIPAMPESIAPQVRSIT